MGVLLFFAALTTCLLCHRCSTVVVPLLPGVLPASLAPSRVIAMHDVMRLSDKAESARVHAMAIWHRQCGEGDELVTVGGDGNIATAPLSVRGAGGALVAAEDTGPRQAWHATDRGSGSSKGYPYAPAHLLAVHSAVGIAVTAPCSGLEVGATRPEVRLMASSRSNHWYVCPAAAVCRAMCGTSIRPSCTLLGSSLAKRSWQSTVIAS